jgi:hypothetical protein
MGPELPQSMLVAWFDKLVKNKMAGVAVCVSGIAISCFLLTFAKLFEDLIFQCVSGVGLLILVTSSTLFVYASFRQVSVSFQKDHPQLKRRDDVAGVTREPRTRNLPQSDEEKVSRKQVALPAPTPTELEVAKHKQDSREPGPDIADPSII